MPLYGSTGLNIEYRYIAVAPLDAEHPLGSGRVVHYEPGDVIPAEHWGNAAHVLVEVGKAERLATNVIPAGDERSGASPARSQVAEEPSHVTEEEAYPVALGGGWFSLSDGSRIRGQGAAEEGQAALNEAA